MEDQFRKWAILALIVQDGFEHQVRVGHTLMQKVVYLLQAALEVNIGYSFKLYHYGPYSEQLWNDLRSLSDLNVLQISADLNGYGYWISLSDQNRVKFIQEQASALPVENVQEVMNLLRDKDSRYLELLATTHFVCSDLVDKKRLATDTDVAGYVTQLKPHFSDTQVKGAIKVLRDYKWLN